MMEPEWAVQVVESVAAGLRLAGSHLDILRADRVHLAIFVEPFLGYILDGRKTVESRFGVQRCAPHGRVSEGDILLLKRSSGPVVAACEVSRTWFFDLQRTSLDEVRRRFARRIAAEDSVFWAARADAKLATLMEVQKVSTIAPVEVDKRDRRGWVVVRERLPLFDLSV